MAPHGHTCPHAQDEALTLQLLGGAEPGGRLTLSTAYLNLTRAYERALASASQARGPLSGVLPSTHAAPSPSLPARCH